MSDEWGSMGNFKGVMLCNRPAQIPGSLQTVVGPTSTSGPTRPAFVSSVVPDTQLGLPPIRHQRVAKPMHKRDIKLKTEDVTWRHKKWLLEFQERRGAIAQSMEERISEQMERKQRFNARSQAMRDAIRGIKSDESTSKEEKASAIEAALNNQGKAKFLPTEYVDVSQQYPSGAPVATESQRVYEEEDAYIPQQQQQQQQQGAPVSSRSNAGGNNKKKAASKPGWARTAEEDDEFLDAEADDLLDFAAGLDYQRYIDDLEVREAIQFVKDRVKNLEESKQNAEAEEIERQKLIAMGELEEVYVVDDSKPSNEDGSPVLKKIVRRVKKNRQPIAVPQQQSQVWDASTNSEGQSENQSERNRQAQQDALSKTVLDSNRQIRNVHSSASVRSIMEKESKAPSAAAAAPSSNSATTLRKSTLTSVNENGEPFRPPVITTIHEVDGNEKKGPNPSNLPFLYRHPGI